jgi:hypothetical protein
MRRVCASMMCALSWMTLPSTATAAAPQPDPAALPSISVVNAGPWANGGHPADGDTFRATSGAWTGLGNTYEFQWQRCATTAASSCSDVEGARSATLLADTLFGGHLRVAVTASNAQGSTTAHSAMTARLNDERAHRIDSSAGPVLVGQGEEGETLTIDGLHRYAGSRPISYGSIVWRRYNSADGDAFTAIANSGDSYVLKAADVGKHIAVVFEIRNGAGSLEGDYTIFSRVGPIQPNTDPPEARTAPAISASDGPQDGRALQGSAGTWSGAGPQTYGFQWQRCAADGGGCADLPGETVSRYTPGGEDVGGRLRLRVTATNAHGSGEAFSEPSAVVAPAPPASTGPPAVSGLARDGQILAGSTGTFSGTPPIASTYAWERCDAQGDQCQTIAGATGSAYSLVPADIAHRLRFKQTATNAGGAATARSAATAVVQAIAPAATVIPTISGTARDEERFESGAGTWTGSPTIALARQWMRCADAAAATSCSAIAGATAAAYTATSPDVGSHLRLRVTAFNFGNATAAFSEPSAVIAAVAPRATSAPAVSGTARDGETLTVTRGVWAGTVPQTYTQRWERCSPGCVPIDGATATTYELTGADVGHRVRAVVIANGPGGATEAASAPTEPVAAVAPVATAEPEVSGITRDGETLTAGEGGWRGSAPMTRTLQWERCDAAGESCTAIAGATAATIALGAGDVGHRMRVAVRAVNAGGEGAARSQPSAVVAGRAPANVLPPAITGDARDGETVTASLGTWTGTSPISHARHWMRCSSADSTAGCEAISGATGATYAITGDDVGSHLRLRVTATNAAGAATAWSPAAGRGAVAATPPAPLEGSGPGLTVFAPGATAPDADQTAPDVGDRIVAEPGSWSGTDRPGHRIEHRFAWERCTAAGCVAVPGRSAAEMTVTADDLGAQLRAMVTAASPAGEQSQATPRLGLTRGAASAAPPTSPTSPAALPATVAAVAGAGGTLALPAGSLLAPSACQSVARQSLSVRAGKAGTVRLSVPAGLASASQPLAAKVTVSRPSALKKATLKLGGKPLKLKKGGARLDPRRLAGSPQLQLVAVPRKGKPATVSGRLTTKGCDALLSVVLRGSRLVLRVDSRAPLARVAFTLPRGLALKVAGGKVGTVETLPFGTAARTVAPAKLGDGVQLNGSQVTLTKLPAGTASASLAVTLSGKGKRGKTLRFNAATTGADGVIRRLVSSTSVAR